jgi:hypothetical protein
MQNDKYLEMEEVLLLHVELRWGPKLWALAATQPDPLRAGPGRGM